MKRAMAIAGAFLCLATYGLGQSPSGKVGGILLLHLGAGQSAITLTKMAFEGDTVYTLTFRNATHSRGGERSTQGFFLFELKELAIALQTALSMDTASEVEFSDGMMRKTKNGTSRERIMVTFTTGTGTCRLTRIETLKLITAIKDECRVGPFE